MILTLRPYQAALIGPQRQDHRPGRSAEEPARGRTAAGAWPGGFEVPGEERRAETGGGSGRGGEGGCRRRAGASAPGRGGQARDLPVEERGQRLGPGEEPRQLR